MRPKSDSEITAEGGTIVPSDGGRSSVNINATAYRDDIKFTIGYVAELDPLCGLWVSRNTRVIPQSPQAIDPRHVMRRGLLVEAFEDCIAVHANDSPFVPLQEQARRQ